MKNFLTLLTALALAIGVASAAPLEKPDQATKGTDLEFTGSFHSNASLDSNTSTDTSLDAEVRETNISLDANLSGSENRTGRKKTVKDGSQKNNTEEERQNSSKIAQRKQNTKAALELRIQIAKDNLAEAKAELRESERKYGKNKENREARRDIEKSEKQLEEAEKDKEKLENASTQEEIESISANASNELESSNSNLQDAQKSLEDARSSYYQNLGLIAGLIAVMGGGGFLYYKIPRKDKEGEGNSPGES